MRRPVAALDAVIDHLAMRRQHGDARSRVIAAGATPLAMISSSACVAAMVWRAAHHGLNETSAKAMRSPSPSVSAAMSGVTP